MKEKLKWIDGDDTGVSSKTIWSVMMDVIDDIKDSSFYCDIPYDPSDFGRCYRLLELFPDWKERLSEVAEIFPIWEPMVKRWDELTALYEKENPSGRCPELYDLMEKLVDEGRICAGWVKTGPGSWKGPKR